MPNHWAYLRWHYSNILPNCWVYASRLDDYHLLLQTFVMDDFGNLVQLQSWRYNWGSNVKREGVYFEKRFVHGTWGALS